MISKFWNVNEIPRKASAILRKKMTKTGLNMRKKFSGFFGFSGSPGSRTFFEYPRDRDYFSWDGKSRQKATSALNDRWSKILISLIDVHAGQKGCFLIWFYRGVCICRKLLCFLRLNKFFRMVTIWWKTKGPVGQFSRPARG